MGYFTFSHYFQQFLLLLILSLAKYIINWVKYVCISYLWVKIGISPFSKLQTNFVLYVPSDHRQRTILRSIEQDWEGLPMKQDHRSNGPTDEPQGTIGQTAPHMNHRGPSVERPHR